MGERNLCGSWLGRPGRRGYRRRGNHRRRRARSLAGARLLLDTPGLGAPKLRELALQRGDPAAQGPARPGALESQEGEERPREGQAEDREDREEDEESAHGPLPGPIIGGAMARRHAVARSPA
ncbi:MAG TPA: hypothetical protein VMS76_05685, partial [Planctomycetota bacterium]|nr:hypothetical protein [Planctomycetota bacterium]